MGGDHGDQRLTKSVKKNAMTECGVEHELYNSITEREGANHHSSI